MSAATIRTTVLRLMLLPLLYSPLASADYRIITSQLPPWSVTQQEGLFIEIVSEIEKRIGDNRKIDFLPWSRAQIMAKTSDNMIIFPLTRIKAREEHYSWILEISTLAGGFLSTSAPITSFEVAKTLPLIIVNQDTPLAAHLIKLGFNNLFQMPTSLDTAARMLVNQRADAWFEDMNRAEYLLKDFSDRKRLHFGPALLGGKLYIAGSKQLSSEIIQAYRKTYSKMKEDGTLAEIIAKYGME